MAEISFALLGRQHLPSILVWNSLRRIVDTQIHFDRGLTSGVFRCPDNSGTPPLQSSATLTWAAAEQFCLKRKRWKLPTTEEPAGSRYTQAQHSWLFSKEEGWSYSLLPHHIQCGLRFHSCSSESSLILWIFGCSPESLTALYSTSEVSLITQ